MMSRRCVSSSGVLSFCAGVLPRAAPSRFLQFLEKCRQPVAVLDVASKESVCVRQEPVKWMPFRLRQRLLFSSQRIDHRQPLGFSECSHRCRKGEFLEERPFGVTCLINA